MNELNNEERERCERDRNKKNKKNETREIKTQKRGTLRERHQAEEQSLLILSSFTNAPNCVYVLARTRCCQAEQHITLIEYRTSVIATTIGAIVGH